MTPFISGNISHGANSGKLSPVRTSWTESGDSEEESECVGSQCVWSAYFVSESSVYRLLKAHDLITSPAFILMKAADTFAQPTTAPNQLWHTDFIYLKVIGWGWFYLSTVLGDFSREDPGAGKLCTTMTATDVSDTLTIALRSSGLQRVRSGSDRAC